MTEEITVRIKAIDEFTPVLEGVIEKVSRLGHFHDLPEIDGPREGRIYSDGCTVEPNDDGSWSFTPVNAA